VTMIFRSTDIETLVDEGALSKVSPTYKLVGGRPHESYQGGEGTYREPVVEVVDGLPPPYACRVVSISTVDVCFDPTHSPPYWYDRCSTECFWAADGSAARADALERRLLQSFHEAMSAGSEVAASLIHLVTWNGRQFDLPVIMMRSLKHGISCRWYYNKDRRGMRYRFTDEGHCDLMDSLADYGAARFMKLGDMARLIGLPGKTDMSGDKVAVLYAESLCDPSRAEELQAKTKRYCLQDSIQTAILWLRSRHLYGYVGRETYNAALATFRESAEICRAIDVNWEGLLL